MMRMIWVFVLLLASMLLGLQLHQDPGHVLVSFRHWTIETTLIVAFLGMLLLSFCIHLLWFVSATIIHLPKAWSRWRNIRHIQGAQNKTRQGFLEFSEGRWRLAKKHLIHALPYAETPLFNYLTAARAAQELGESALRDDYLREAKQAIPEAGIAIELTQAQLQLAEQQWEQALATLQHVQEQHPNHPYVLKLLLQLYEEVHDDEQCIALLPALKHHRILTDEALHRLEKRLYLNALIKRTQQPSLDVTKTFMQSLPKTLAQDLDIQTVYLQALIHQHEPELAETLLRRTLHKTIHSPMLILYSELPSTCAQLPFIESLLKNNPHHPAVLLCLARLYVAQNIIGLAIQSYESSMASDPNPIAYAELGLLYEKQGDRERAYEAYRTGLRCLSAPAHLIQHT